ncbi:MAG TPA: flavin reductase family protein [Clostridia bacterium]|nr:flavin reductase family protein [Clostridia bacterium]
MSEFSSIKPEQLQGNVFDKIGNQWMLITAGDGNSFNTMTASWGGMGVLWSRPVAFAFIRPTRYTYEFVEKSDRFSLSFYDENYREALNLCGTKSGRDLDKAKATGLTPVEAEKTVYFEQAKLVLICKKLYSDDFKQQNFIDRSVDEQMYHGDYHRMYIGEIEKILIKK